MSTRNEHDLQTDVGASSEHGVAADARTAAMQRRRRFMKIGASAVPVSLTLSSRPVMAWHCNTTSAWGSAILMNGGASVKARANSAVISNTECWYRSDWQNDTARAAVSQSTPWTVVGSKKFSGKDAAYAKANLLIGHIFPDRLVTVSGSANVFDTLVAKKSTYFEYLIVARLNAIYSGNTGVAACTMSGSKDMTQEMARLGAGSFKPSNSTGSAWTADDIMTYLSQNWLAR